MNRLIKRPWGLLALCMLLGVSFLAIQPWKKSAVQQTGLAINFVTFTNVSGTNLAVFRVSNSGGPPIETDLPPEIELRETPRNNPGRTGISTQVYSGHPLTVTVVAPTTREEWRVALDFYTLDLRDRLSLKSPPLLWRWIGHRSVLTSNAHSEWFAPTASAEWFHL